MASSNQKIPIPLPVSGVMKDQNPRTIGPTALVNAQNWVYRDGVFSVRPGVGPLDPGGVNLLAIDYLATLDMSTFPFQLPLEDAVGFPGQLPNYWEPVNNLAAEFWTPFGQSLEEYVADVGWVSDAVRQPGDPSFLNHTTGHYLKILQVANPVNEFDDHYFGITSPVLAARNVPYMATIKIAGNSTSAKVYARLCAFHWIEPIGDGPSRFVALRENGTELDIFSHTGNPVVDFAGWTDVSHDWTNPDPVYLRFNNTVASGEWVALLIFFDGPTNSYWGLSDVMIYEGVTEIPFEAPSGYWYMGQRPMGFVEFAQSPTNPITVVGTTHGLWEMNNDFTLSPINGALWSFGEADPPAPPGTPVLLPASDNTKLVSFRVFDGTGGRVLLAVNGEAEALEWDGSAAAAVVGGAGGGIVAKCLAVCFNRVIYGNISGAMPGVTAPDGVMVTDALYHKEAELHPTWIARLADTPGHIVAMLEIGNMQTAIYKTDCIYVAIGQGMDPSFRFELRCTCAGPASPLAVVALSDGVHAYLSNTGDVIIFDGVRPHSLGQYVQAYIQSTIDFDRADQTVAFFNKERKELYFLYPPYGGGEIYHCVMISMSSEPNSLWPLGWNDSVTVAGQTTINLSKTIGQLEGTVGDLPGIIGDFTSLRPAFLMLDAAGGPLIFEGNTDWRGPIESYLQTGLYDLGSQTSFKTLQEIDHIFHTDSGQEITVDVLVSDYGKEQASDGPRTIQLGSSGPRVTRHRATGRMFSLRISGSTTGVVEWLGSEASVVVRGLR